MNTGKISPLSNVANCIKTKNLAHSTTPVLLMVSGGSDSCALTYLAHELSKQKLIGPLAIMHVNHHIRTNEAERDQNFVQSLAQLLELPLYIVSIDVPARAKKTGSNLEAVARNERYQAATQKLQDLCAQHNYPLEKGRIFTAHTQDDRVENFYMRSIVGTGPGGFRSMRYKNGLVVRPCLDCSKEELQNYLIMRKEMDLPHWEENGKLWCEDSTNSHTEQFRSYVRHEIIPQAKKRNAALLQTLSRSMNLIAEEDDYLNTCAQDLLESCVVWFSDNKHEGCLILPPFSCAHPVLQRRAIYLVLQNILDADARIENASIEAIIKGFTKEKPISGYRNNIQGNLAISSNKRGLRIEPMEQYRKRRGRC